MSEDKKQSLGEKKPDGPTPFDVSKFRTPPELTQVKRRSNVVRASPYPPNGKFFRILPFNAETEENCLRMAFFKFQFENDTTEQTYVVQFESEPYEMLADKVRHCLVVAGITRGKNVFLWELKLPTGNHEWDGAAESRMTVAQRGQTEWIRPVWVAENRGYDDEVPVATYPEPDWTRVDFLKMVSTAYAKRQITSVEHPVIKEHFGL